MQIIEVKNNYVKIGYEASEQELVLSGFLVIKDRINSFIAQIMHLEANSEGNFAVAKLLFNFDEQGAVTGYNGAIPSISSPVGMVYPQEILELFNAQTPILLGELAQQKTPLKLDCEFLKEKLLVCCEKISDSRLLTENLNAQLCALGKKVLVFDLAGNLDFSKNKLTAGKSFKLPLNSDTINFIYEKGLVDAKAETKALLQEVFLELQNYVKTIPDMFIPFETFLKVVDEQYQQLGYIELVLLKNKLLRFFEKGVFAQQKKDFAKLKASLKHPVTTIFNLSKMDEMIQREMISYAYRLIKTLDKDVFVIVNLGENSDKKLLKQIFTTKNAFTTIICSYSYKYLNELKQISKNLFLFSPLQPQNYFAGYNTFLNKLNAGEFIVYGSATNHIPFIVKLSDIPQTNFENPAVAPPTPTPEQVAKQEIIEEQIKKEVDEIYTRPKSEIIQTEEPSVVTVEDLSDDDLDFIENIISIPSPKDETKKESISPLDEISVYTQEEPSQEPPAQEFFEGQMQQENEEILNISSQSEGGILPVYSAEIQNENPLGAQSFEQGEIVYHPKYGKGTVEKIISYGTKSLCSIQFENVGRRLLDPALAEIKKISEQ